MSGQDADKTNQDPYLRADRDGHTLACPACDAGQRWYLRSDDTVRCRECDHECHRGELVERLSERGLHTPTEACARGGVKGGNSHSDAFMQRIASKARGRNGDA